MASWGLHLDVKLEEDLLEGLLVALAFEALELDELLLEVLLHPQGYLLAYTEIVLGHLGIQTEPSHVKIDY